MRVSLFFLADKTAFNVKTPDYDPNLKNVEPNFLKKKFHDLVTLD